MTAPTGGSSDVATVRFAVIAALPREVALLVGKRRPDPASLGRGVHLWRVPGGLVSTAGMGAERATVACAAVREAGLAEGLLLSVGLAGACTGGLREGEAAEIAEVVDARTGERFQTEAADGCVLATGDAIAGVREKARLAATYGAALVDMEAAAVARLAVAHGLRFRAIKGVSDAHDFEMESLSRFAGRHGTFRTGAFAVHTALRPHHWGKVVRLGGASQRALTAMHGRLRLVLAEA